MNFDEKHKACLFELIQKMDSLFESNTRENNFIGNNTRNNKNYTELKDLILSLEKENKILEDENKLLKVNLEESVKANDKLYEKYEQTLKNKDFEKVKSECEKLELIIETKERELKGLAIQHRDELSRLNNKNEELKLENDLVKEKLLQKRNEVNKMMIYKQKASRIDEVDKMNFDLKAQIAQLQITIKEIDKVCKNKDFQINNLELSMSYRNDEIKQLKDKIIEFEGEVTKYKNIKIDMQTQIEKVTSELRHCNEELEDSRKRLEYAEQMNFNEYSSEGLNFDLSERIKMLEEQNEELRNNQEHQQKIELKNLETKLREADNENKNLKRSNQKIKMKYERFEQEKEAKLLAKEKIKLLEKEVNDSNLEKKRVSDQLLRSYQEIARLK